MGFEPVLRARQRQPAAAARVAEAPALLSIILPARNEAGAVGATVAGIRARYPEAEIIVVDDGSSDATAQVAEQAGARVISKPYGMGNGAAVKTGARAAGGDVLVFMDADGQHDPADIPRLLAKLDAGYDMFRESIHLLPNGFSYPTTSTMAFFRSAYPVAYVPITAPRQRVGIQTMPRLRRHQALSRGSIHRVYVMHGLDVIATHLIYRFGWRPFLRRMCRAPGHMKEGERSSPS